MKFFAIPMRYSDQVLDEIRERLAVSDVVRRRVQLKKQGREWRGLSPFQQEKTPSFYVNDQKGFYHDFSSGKSGDIFAFVMETEGLSFPEAVESLAGLAGVPLPKATADQSERDRRQSSLAEIVELATQFFESQLASARGSAARAYLERRGVLAATQQEFRLGYAPADRSALKQHLGARGIAIADMVEAGLLVAGPDIPVPYDRFRDRLVIPIQDGRGKVIGFGGRALSAEAQPKYLNSPETPLFHKGAAVFNVHRARQAAFEDGSVVAVEGYLDAITVYQAGLKSVVATMGTAFTEAQIEALWRLSEEPIVCFDADRAGVAAAHRVIDRILPALRVGRAFRFAFLSEGKDPDEFVRQRGLEAFRSALGGSLSLWDVLWDREVAAARLDTPDARAKFEHRINTIVRTIADPAVQNAYARMARVELSDLFWQASRAARGGKKKDAKPGLVDREIVIARDGHRHGIQKVILGLLVHYPQFVDEKSDEIAAVEFDPDLETFRKALYNLLVEKSALSVELVYEELGGRYYEILHDIHGRSADGKRWGYSLFRRFPIVAREPDPEFVSACLSHFLRVLYLEQLRAEIGMAKTGFDSSGSDIDAASDRLVELVRSLQLEQEQVNARDLELAEWATGIRTLGGPTEAQWPMAISH